MKKKRTTVTINKSVLEALKEEHRNISAVLNDLAKRYVTHEDNNVAVKHRIEMVKEDIEEHKQQIKKKKASIEEHKQKIKKKKATLERLEEIKEEREKEQGEYKERINRLVKTSMRGGNLGRMISAASEDFNKNKEEIKKDIKKKEEEIKNAC